MKIGILGTGAAGLCIAMILKQLGREFEILEARPKVLGEDPGPVGGRRFTYYFDKSKKQQYDYFDVGAMRFPYIPGMYPTFDLIDWLQLKDHMIEYYFKSKGTVHYFNDRRGRDPPFLDDTFKVGVDNAGTVPQELANKDASDFLDKIFGKLANEVSKPGRTFEEVYKKVIEPLDKFSTRNYLMTLEPIKSFPEPGNQAAVTWLETNGFGTNMYDTSCIEALMDYLEFGVPYPHANLEQTKPSPPKSPQKGEGYKKDGWYCLLGGTQDIAYAMYDKIGPSNVKFGKTVTSVTVDTDSNSGVMVTTADGEVSTYYHVVSTMSLGCLQTVDLTGALLSYEQKTAIRCAHYSESAKVGIKWKSRRWEDQLHIKGGQSFTDRPTRTVVFPSYGCNVSGAPAVMIASYNWSQDASRFGALMKGPSSEEEKSLIKTIITDIAEMHGKTYEELKLLYVDHFAWNWQNCPYTRGCFALFNPGQFYEMFTAITRPAGAGFFHFAGEATSVHHAWISGALASAYRSVAEILMMEGHKPDEAEAILEKALAGNHGKQPLMRPPEEVDMELLQRQVVYGVYHGQGGGLKDLEERLKATSI